LRRSRTAAGLLPERVDATTGEPRSTVPLGWSHALTLLALREMWPAGTEARARLRAGVLAPSGRLTAGHKDKTSAKRPDRG